MVNIAKSKGLLPQILSISSSYNLHFGAEKALFVAVSAKELWKRSEISMETDKLYCRDLTMEIFKKGLKAAIEKRVEGIIFTEGKVPSLIHIAKQEPVAGLPALSRDEVIHLINLLINNQTASNGPVQGELAVTNIGTMKLIGTTVELAELYVFIPPTGNQMFISTWNRLNPEAVSTDPLPLEPNNGLPPPPPTIPSGSDIPNDIDFSAAADPMKSAPPPPPPPPQATVPPPPPQATIPPPPSVPSQNELSFDATPIPTPPASPELSMDSSLNPSDIDFGSEAPAAPPPSLDFGSEAPATPPGEIDFATAPLVPLAKPDFSVQTPAPVALAPDPAPPAATNIAHPPHPSPSQDHSQEEVRIHFGATLPDEMIDPNQRHPIDPILKVMVDEGASDLHLIQGQPYMLRLDGEIIRKEGPNLDETEMEKLILPIMPPKNIREFAEISDTDFAYAVPGLARFRVNVFRNMEGVAAVLRQIPDEVLTADQLGLSKAIRELCYLTKGLVLVTGPTGSGKSTTLAGMIDLINSTRKDHILTIEDPVEFVHKQKMCLVNQREVHKHTMSFSRALKAALREDPDIILIGELRDLETIAIAIETAETGHLVFGTLHTNTAISTVDRVVDQFPADQQEQIRVMLAESLKGVISQTLIKKKGGGRCAAQEILIVDRAAASLIREGNTHMMGNHMQTQKTQGNVLLNDALMQLVIDDKIELKDAYMKAIDKANFMTLVKAKGLKFD